MKQILALLAFMAFAHLVQAQEARLIWKYKDYDGAIPVTAPRWVVHIGSWFADEKADRKLIRKVHKLKLLVFEEEGPITAADREKFNARAQRRGLEDIIAVREGNTHVRIMAKERRAVIRKIVFFVQSPEEFVLVSLRGRFKLDDLAKGINRYLEEERASDGGAFPDVLDVPVKKM